MVVTLLEPTAELKPGLSTTAKITTATRQSVLTIPIQALTIRENEKEKEGQTPSSNPSTAKAAGSSEATLKGGTVSASKTSKKKEEQGVFILRDAKAMFVPVTTGITGQTEIEVLSGLKEGDEIVTGSYKTLRTLKTDTKVKVDNKEAGKDEKKAVTRSSQRRQSASATTVRDLKAGVLIGESAWLHERVGRVCLKLKQVRWPTAT